MDKETSPRGGTYLRHGGREEMKWPVLGPRVDQEDDNRNWLKIM
jgi:hypothetical protein